MFKQGERIKYYNNEAVVLVCSEQEVLLLIDKGYVKWVDKNLVESPRIR